MADFIASISSVSALRTWWDSTVPATVVSGDRYIAELAAGTYDLNTVSTTWGSKTVSGAIIIRPQSGAKLTTATRALRAGTDGVLFAFPNSNVNFTSANVTIDGCQLASSAAPSATLQLSTGGVVSRCILDDVKVTFDNNGGSILDSLIERTQTDVCAWLPNTCTVSGNTFIHFGGGTAVATGTAIAAKNNAFVSIGGTAAFSGSMDGSSTNNAFNVGTTYGTSPVTITPSSQFVSVASHAAADLRLQSGASLATGGVASGGTGTDIYYQARTASYSVGAYELDAGGGGTNASVAGADFVGSGTFTPGAATTSGGSTGSITIGPIGTGTGAGKWANSAVLWSWFTGAIGSNPAHTLSGSGTTDANGQIVLSGLTTTPGFGLVRNTDGTIIAYQPGTPA